MNYEVEQLLKAVSKMMTRCKSEESKNQLRDGIGKVWLGSTEWANSNEGFGPGYGHGDTERAFDACSHSIHMHDASGGSSGTRSNSCLLNTVPDLLSLTHSLTHDCSKFSKYPV